MSRRIVLAAYLASIVTANLLAARFGPAATIPIAFVLIALDLTARDRLHDAWHGRHLAPKMGALIAAGGAISYVVTLATQAPTPAASPARIALASTAAFAAAATVDGLAYTAARRLPKLGRVNASNVPSAAVDSVLFPLVAFGPPGLLVAAGQFAAKVLGGALWSLVLFTRARKGAAA